LGLYIENFALARLRLLRGGWLTALYGARWALSGRDWTCDVYLIVIGCLRGMSACHGLELNHPAAVSREFVERCHPSVCAGAT